MDKKIRIIVCEDQKILLDGLVGQLNKNKQFKIVGAVESADEILPLLRKKQADLVLTDIVTKNKKNALDVVVDIRREFPEMKIITITGFPDISFMEKAKSVGVASFVYKNISTEELYSAIKNTYAGYSTYPHEDTTNKLMLSSLSEVEMKILRMYCTGKEREQIAKELFMANATLKAHISSILQKTGFSSLARVAIYATNNGLIVTE